MHLSLVIGDARTHLHLDQRFEGAIVDRFSDLSAGHALCHFERIAEKLPNSFQSLLYLESLLDFDGHNYLLKNHRNITVWASSAASPRFRAGKVGPDLRAGRFCREIV